MRRMDFVSTTGRSKFELQLRLLRQERGQAAIFVALIFQVLFVFFAMVINVGLLVHQKINLQNSVDLAAYYGAMKQAEELNAIAHMNYQIRQAWKLLMFRYQQIGSGGDDTLHPYSYTTKTFRSESDAQPYDRANVFCYAYEPFEPQINGENYCRKMPSEMGNPQTIPIPGRSSFSAGSSLISFDAVIISISTNLVNQAMKACERISGLNWFGLARYLAGYKMDLANRKKALYIVANGMSKSTEDFLDLDGNSAREGILKTLKKNLSPENRDSFKETDLKVYNSLGSADCGFADEQLPPKWLSETSIHPTFYYADTDCVSAGNTSVNFVLKIINEDPNGLPKYPAGYTNAINALKPYILEPDGSTPSTKLYKSALGFEKNPWCMAYVKVEAQTTPSIPFSPFGKVTLKAKAFAKPFGGKIGPWYGTTWNRGAASSDKAKRIDDRVPERVGPGEFPDYTATTKAANLQPNYSRYVGDPLGTRSKLSTGYLGKEIHSMGKLSYSWWDHILKENLEDASSSGDPLAWDSDTNKAPPMRNLEIAAISPDHFDLNYYSVEPDYYRNYLVRLEQRKDKGRVSFRGDLGSRRDKSDQKMLKFSVKDQVAVTNDATKPPVQTEKLTYLVTKVYSLLNSWQGKDHENYVIDPTRFGMCGSNSPPESNSSVIKDDKGPEKAAPGNCIDGGRVGYSVKLVDETHLRGEQINIGGQGQSGTIKNPPPN
jgi:hypothetical protein